MGLRLIEKPLHCSKRRTGCGEFSVVFYKDKRSLSTAIVPSQLTLWRRSFQPCPGTLSLGYTAEYEAAWRLVGALSSPLGEIGLSRFAPPRVPLSTPAAQDCAYLAAAFRYGSLVGSFHHSLLRESCHDSASSPRTPDSPQKPRRRIVERGALLLVVTFCSSRPFCSHVLVARSIRWASPSRPIRSGHNILPTV